MFEITCPKCHYRAVSSVEGTTAVCGRCKTSYPIPRGYTLLESSFKYAADARQRRDFSAAQASYTEILKQHPGNAAAYWFRAISRYQVEYQKIGEGQYRLVCHQALLKDFAADADVRKAISLADAQEAAYYNAESARISQLQKQVSSHASLTAPYDVILAVDAKNPAALEKARLIRTGVNAAGMHCLCPALDLQDIPRQDWEPYLYHGMTTSTAMVYVAVGRDAFPEDSLFDAQRYLSLKAASQREAAGLIQQFIVAFERLDEYEDIPDELFDGADQRLSMSASGFVDHLCQLLSGSGADYDRSLRTESGAHENYAYTNLLRQARLSLEGGDFTAAERSFNEILNYNPRESQAYWGLLLAGLHCKDEDTLIKKGAKITDYGNYRSAVAFANEREAQTYQQVAEGALQTYKLHAAQQAERDRIMREQAAARAQKDAELLQDMELQRRKKARQRILRIALSIVLVIALVVGGIVGYRKYNETAELRTMYKQAMDYYNGGDYPSAMNLFIDLGDYKDSAEMLETCNQEYVTVRFYDAKFDEHDLNRRESAVETMRDVVEVIPEAQEYLDRWEQEAEDYFAQGEYAKALKASKGFGSSYPIYMKVWRFYQNQGLIAASDTGSILALSMGQLKQLNCEHLGIPDGIYKSVSLSNDGESAGLIRADGTALIAGDIRRSFDVSGWTDMLSIRVTHDQVVGLRTAGTLLCAENGVVAKDIIQFDIHNGFIAATRSDGTIYTNVPELQEVAAQQENVMEVAISVYNVESMGRDAKLFFVDNNNCMRQVCFYGDFCGITEDGSDVKQGSVVSVITDSKESAVLTTSGRVYSSSNKTSAADYDHAFLVDLSKIMDVRIRPDMGGYGLNGMDDMQIQMRKFIGDLEDIGMPE